MDHLKWFSLALKGSDENGNKDPKSAKTASKRAEKASESATPNKKSRASPRIAMEHW